MDGVQGQKKEQHGFKRKRKKARLEEIRSEFHPLLLPWYEVGQTSYMNLSAFSTVPSRIIAILSLPHLSLCPIVSYY